MVKTIRRILIANRGEIASRIIRSSHAMGIDTVAIYADGDAAAPFVRDADVAIGLDGTTSLETYLNVEKVLTAARQSRSDAIHPGYGFLAESEAFARAVADAGLIWIGPSSEAIAKMGDKLSAKRLMQETGVPTLPSTELKPEIDPKEIAGEVGYPLLVKASAGGGGKGMRVVTSEAELAEAVEGARREAAAAFDDDTIFFERWLTKTRHVEIQVLGDEHGNVVHCFERECSIQRRHQKIIEESPSPALTPELREKIGAAAVAATKAIGYTSAGTVEFLLEGDAFWFLEMNTRLQVEHPVTEAITGLDLVREQLLIAQGESLSFSQSDLSIDGHAIEARLYAEDPANDFLPAAGIVEYWRPSTSVVARFDTSIETGSQVGIEFDPMIAKIIVHAPTRREAASKLARALETTCVMGITTNRDFLASVLRSPQYLTGDTTTDFIERVDPPRILELDRSHLAEAAIAVAMLSQYDRRFEAEVLPTIQTGWRNTLMPLEMISFQHDQGELTVGYRVKRDGRFRVEVDGETYVVQVHARESQGISLTINRRRMAFTIISCDNRWLTHGPNGSTDFVELPRFPDREKDALAGGLVAPMPGKVLETYVAVGDRVEERQLLLILEAMKMEHRITAPMAGIVSELKVKAGDQVANGELLIILSTESDESGKPA